MKQLLFSAILLLFSLSIFAQATPVGELRVANATTAFGVNVPVGTKIFNYAAGVQQYWVATAAIASDKSISTALASLKLLNSAEQAISSAVGVISLSNTASDGTVGTPSAVTLTGNQINVAAGAANEIVLTAQQTLGITSDASINTVTLENGGDAVLTAATAVKAGLMTADQFKILFPSGAPVDENPVTGRLYVQTIEQVGAAPTATEFDLTYATKKGMEILVSLNGVELFPTTATIKGYSFDRTLDTNKHIVIDVPTLQYDRVVITYNR